MKKTDYLKFIFQKTRIDLTRYNISNSDKELVNNLFDRLIDSKNLLRDFYILSHIKELKNIGKYFIFILKKIEDDGINFENLSQNINADTEFIENEILNFLSNPVLREGIRFDYTEEEIDNDNLTEVAGKEVDETYIEKEEIEPEEYKEEETEILNFKKNYLELIQSEANENEDTVYELPRIGNESKEEDEFAKEIPTEAEDKTETSIEIKDEEITESNEINEEKILETSPIENEGDTDIKAEETKEEKVAVENEEPETTEQRIQLSEEIQEELDLFEKGERGESEEELFIEEAAVEEPPTNAAFVEYEYEVKERNEYLNDEFDKMIDLINPETVNNYDRDSIIKNIILTGEHLESISRKMSLEIISNVYQTITLSFEKISDGKYDISESTLNLFKKGLSLVISLIKGDDYFGYKDILKSIENIRNALLEEKVKRERYLRQQKEKQELEKKLSQRYPDDSQRIQIKILKQLIKDTEGRFNSIDKISGEYQIYEALRSLSGNLNNFKEIVMTAKELEMTKLVQLAEAGYIFIKFLQNYRINPVTIESKEIFGYIVYNLKLLVMDTPVEDIDIFISYLNDPVKIFSKTAKKKD